MEQDAASSGATYNKAKDLFVSLGRKERPNFNVTIHNAKKNRLIENKNGTLHFLMKGLKKIQGVLSEIGEDSLHPIKSIENFAPIKRSDELLGTEIRGNAIVAARQIDFVILTALEEERDAILGKLPGNRRLPPTTDDIRVYYEAEVPAKYPDDSTHQYSIIVLSLLSMGRVEAANAAGDAIRRWHPRYVLLVGIAGGISESGVKLGDVIVPDQIVDYELQKVTPDGPQVRNSVHRADARLVGAAQNLNGDDWLKLVVCRRPGKGAPRRIIGPIASGDKIVAAKEFLTMHRSDWPKLLGVEMEAGGAASASFQADYRPGFFMVRGISDLADEKKDSTHVKGWRSYASDIAAAFTIALLQSGPVPASKLPWRLRGSGLVF